MSGRYGNGEYLPSDEVLTEMFDVSRATIRRAMLSLEGEGLIERRQGRSTRVIWPGRSQAAVSSLSRHLEPVEYDEKSSVAFRSYELVVPPETVWRSLGLGPTETAWRLVRIRMHDNQPMWMMTNYFSASIGQKLKDERWARTSIFDALMRIGHACQQAEETVGATLADPEVAKAIIVKVGSPLLELARLMTDAEGRPIGYQLTLVPPERRKVRLIIQAGDDGVPDAGVLVPLAQSIRPKHP